MWVNPIRWKVMDPDINNFQTVFYQDHADTLLLFSAPGNLPENQSTPAVIFIPVNNKVSEKLHGTAQCNSTPPQVIWRITTTASADALTRLERLFQQMLTVKPAASFHWKSGKLLSNHNFFFFIFFISKDRMSCVTFSQKCIKPLQKKTHVISALGC